MSSRRTRSQARSQARALAQPTAPVAPVAPVASAVPTIRLPIQQPRDLGDPDADELFASWRYSCDREIEKQGGHSRDRYPTYLEGVWLRIRQMSAIPVGELEFVARHLGRPFSMLSSYKPELYTIEDMVVARIPYKRQPRAYSGDVDAAFDRYERVVELLEMAVRTLQIKVVKFKGSDYPYYVRGV